jgi:hypothetical protein
MTGKGSEGSDVRIASSALYWKRSVTHATMNQCSQDYGYQEYFLNFILLCFLFMLIEKKKKKRALPSHF